jgi:DNA-binding MarR family transcriptional regulator
MNAREEIEYEKTASYLLAKVATAYRNALENHMARVNLHSGQVFVLMELWKKDGLRQVDIADRLDLRPPTINKMLKALIDMKLVTRESIAGDKRSTRIFLTNEGWDVRKEVSAQWLELEAEYMSGLSETERLILPDLLGKLRSAYTGRSDEE